MSMKKILGLISLIILIGIDQGTKYLAVLYLKGQASFVLIKNVFELSYLENRGAAFGILQNKRYIFVIITLIVMGATGYAYYKLPQAKRFMPLRGICILLTAGALGNMIDRVIQGYVVDFFYFKLINFPVFNVADIYVVVSAVLLVLLVLFYYKEEEFQFLERKR